MIQRLIDFYNRYNYDCDKTLSKIWSDMVIENQGRLTSALMFGSVSDVQAIFDNPNGVLHGLDDPVMQYWGKEITTEFFPLLAQRIGVLPVPNRVQPSPNENWKAVDGVELRERIEKVVGPIRVANGFLSVCTDNGIPYMHFLKLGQWFTIQSLMGNAPLRMLEIGAGCGGLAQVAFQNGVTDYTIIDIPSVAILSAYYMAKVYGEDKVWLSGEPPNESAVGRWFPHNAYEGAMQKYDLVANCNSLPEMSVENQDGYLRFIYECIGENGLFYSHNHESNLCDQRRVRDAINSHGGFKCIYRAPNMIRDGYLEEFYRRK